MVRRIVTIHERLEVLGTFESRRPLPHPGAVAVEALAREHVLRARQQLDVASREVDARVLRAPSRRVTVETLETVLPLIDTVAAGAIRLRNDPRLGVLPAPVLVQVHVG